LGRGGNVPYRARELARITPYRAYYDSIREEEVAKHVAKARIFFRKVERELDDARAAPMEVDADVEGESEEEESEEEESEEEEEGEEERIAARRRFSPFPPLLWAMWWPKNLGGTTAPPWRRYVSAARTRQNVLAFASLVCTVYTNRCIPDNRSHVLYGVDVSAWSTTVCDV
jgi:hypothetical protein